MWVEPVAARQVRKSVVKKANIMPMMAADKSNSIPSSGIKKTKAPSPMKPSVVMKRIKPTTKG
jgi:hypothetical protein